MSNLDTPFRLSNAELLTTDCRLPACLKFHSPNPSGCYRKVLLTGATGFLGAEVLHALLRDTEAEVVCLVRGADQAGAEERLWKALGRAGRSRHTVLTGRVRVLHGALGEPLLGMSSADYAEVCATVDTILHCAARVDWVASYEELRSANVRAIAQLLRVVAIGCPKEFHFVSSAALCYLFPGAGEISEVVPLAARAHGMILPYARSKFAAEEIVREASRRGLAAKVFRPSIILGDSETGAFNQSDIVFRMLKTCVRLGLAPDLNLVLDYCPVDFVASAVVALAREPGSNLETFHLLNPSRVRWAELVLWLNLFGYDVRLVPMSQWLGAVAREVAEPAHPLHRLQSFLLEPLEALGGLTHFQIYEDGRTTRPSDELTRQSLARLNLHCPPLTADLLERYIQWMIERRHLPPPRHRCPVRGAEAGSLASQARALQPAALEPAAPEPSALEPSALEPFVRSALDDRSAQIIRSERSDVHFSDSITSALVAWRYGRHIGISRYRVDAAEQNGRCSRLTMVVKTKPFEHELREALVAAARLCSDSLADAFAAVAEVPGFSGSTVREAEVYRWNQVVFQRHVPRFYGVLPQPDDRPVLVMEDVPCAEFGNSGNRMAPWRPELVEAAVRGMARLHAAWYARGHQLTSEHWLGRGSTLQSMLGARPLWEALADFAGKQLLERADLGGMGSSVAARLRSYVDSLEQWWPALEAHPRTLVHNDLNPRNISFRGGGGTPTACVYDWELAGIGVPQRDLAELLCFVLAPGRVDEAAGRYVELHRTELERASGRRIDPVEWHEGFGLALRELLVTRLAMYAIVYRFRREEFVPRAMAAWQALQQWHGRGTTAGRAAA